MKLLRATVVLLAAGMLTWCFGMNAKVDANQGDGWQAVGTNQVPAIGAFYLMSTVQNGRPAPPFPANLTSSTNLYVFGDSNAVFIVDDRPAWQRTDSLLSASWANFRESIALGWIDGQISLESAQIATAANRIMRGGSFESDLLFAPDVTNFGTAMYLAVTQVTNTNIYINAVNTTNYLYQLGSRTNLVTDAGWLFEQEFTGLANGNPVALNPVPEQGRSNAFFWAVHAGVKIGIASNFVEGFIEDPNAVEPYPSTGTGGQDGSFIVQTPDLSNVGEDVTVHYRIGGTATMGVDYSNLTGNVTIFAGQNSATIVVHPIADYLVEGDETVILTLAIGTNYLLDTNHLSAAIVIRDTIFEPVANLAGVTGIDYMPSNNFVTSNSLVVSAHWDTGTPFNFYLVSSNGTVTNWTGISGIPDEVKLATVKTTSNNFTSGEMFFGDKNSPTTVGLLLPDASYTNLSFATPTNLTYTPGGFCFDQTGVWNGDLLMVQADTTTTGTKGLWRIHTTDGTNGIASNVANISTTLLEGVITLPNDTNTWGPWAGKAITGDETSNTIFAVAPNGTFSTFSMGISSEDFKLIPTNQNLYACDQTGFGVMKVSSNFFTNYAEQLLISQEGVGTSTPQLNIIRWNSSVSNFVINVIPYHRTNGNNGDLEAVTFAPINIPTIHP